MFKDFPPILQALTGGLFTWGLTALGAASVFILKANSKKLLDVSLGFAAGVMTAASFWSLLSPAIEIAENSFYKKLAFLPVAAGFALGAAFVYGADRLMAFTGFHSATTFLMARRRTALPHQTAPTSNNKIDGQLNEYGNSAWERNGQPMAASSTTTLGDTVVTLDDNNEVNESQIQVEQLHAPEAASPPSAASPSTQARSVGLEDDSWRRIFLLIVAIVVHNIPEGLAVGVGFGSVNKTEEATYGKAFNLALGIGLQVLDDIVPEARTNDNGKLATLGAIIGFIVMMSMDVGLG